MIFYLAAIAVRGTIVWSFMVGADNSKMAGRIGSPNSSPSDCWHTDGPAGVVIGAAHRDWSSGLFALFFGLFWNGLLSIFITTAVAATLHNLNLSLPDWFPALKFEDAWLDGPSTIWFWLFLMPFIGIGLFCVAWFLSSIFGRTEVRVRNQAGEIFVGLGRIGYRRRFDTTCIRNVLLRRVHSTEGPDMIMVVLVPSDGPTIKFCSMLPKECCRFIANRLQIVLGR